MSSGSVRSGPSRVSFLQSAGLDVATTSPCSASGPAAGDSMAGRATVGRTTSPGRCSTLADLRDLGVKLREAGALTGSADQQHHESSLRGGIDGLEFEVCWLVPPSFLSEEVVAGKSQVPSARSRSRDRTLRGRHGRRRLRRRWPAAGRSHGAAAGIRGPAPRSAPTAFPNAVGADRGAGPRSAAAAAHRRRAPRRRPSSPQTPPTVSAP